MEKTGNQYFLESLETYLAVKLLSTVWRVIIR